MATRTFAYSALVGWLCLFASAGCELDSTEPSTAFAESADSTQNPNNSPVSAGSSSQSVVGDPIETIAIGSYNIQVFGQSKLADEASMQTLVQVVHYFDVVAIQEIRSKKQDVLPRFIEMLNADGAQYEYVIGPRLGRTISKEQYAYVYDSSRIELVGEPFTIPDQDDWVHREPFVASFRVRHPKPQLAFTFTLINIHTDPDEVMSELSALDDMYRWVRTQLPHEDDFILLGDLNTSEQKLGELDSIPELAACIRGATTNTAGTAAYDNILYDRFQTTEFTGIAGVFPVEQEFKLTREQATRVSDHFPVWAEFSTTEQPGGSVASRPGSPISSQ